MTNDEARQKLRETFKEAYGYFPNDEQFREFIEKEVKPAVLWAIEQEKQNELKRTD